MNLNTIYPGMLVVLEGTKTDGSAIHIEGWVRELRPLGDSQCEMTLDPTGPGYAQIATLRLRIRDVAPIRLGAGTFP